jgi:starvation-inducible DNA-binding protein
VSELITELKTTLSNVVAVYLRSHGYHWNVEGSDFAQYHALFETIYTDIYESIDPLAENIRKLGDYPPYRLERLVELKTVPEPTRVANDPRSLATDLLDANVFLVSEYKALFKVANDADEQGIANFVAERIDQHEKWAWQLRASVK